MKKFYLQKLKQNFSKKFFFSVNFICFVFSNLFNMKNEYEQSPIEERQIWREKLINRFMNTLDQQGDNIIEKSVKFIR